MLKNSLDRSRVKKKIAVCTGCDSFTRLLETLLSGWGYEIQPPSGAPDVLTLLDPGCTPQSDSQQVLRMQASAAANSEGLGLPVDIESLWKALERHFHEQPRLHMRRAVDLPARVLFRGEWRQTRLSSLSDMGGRFHTDGELVRQESVTLEFDVNGEVRKHEGRVIFSMPVHAEADRSFQSGVVFYGLDRDARNRLRTALLRQFLEEVRSGVSPQEFQEGLAFFDLEPELRSALLSDD